MPFDGKNYKPDFTTFTTAEKLRYLADFMEGLRPEQVDMEVVHSKCGTAHCAYGWGRVIGLFGDGYTDRSTFGDVIKMGITFAQGVRCFGAGGQFNYLNRPYTPADVARHLREVADEVARDGKS